MKHFSGNSSLIQVAMNSFIKTLFWNIYLCLLVLFFSWTNILLTRYTKQVPPCKVLRWNIWKKKSFCFSAQTFSKRNLPCKSWFHLFYCYRIPVGVILKDVWSINLLSTDIILVFLSVFTYHLTVISWIITFTLIRQ